MREGHAVTGFIVGVLVVLVAIEGIIGRYLGPRCQLCRDRGFLVTATWGADSCPECRPEG